MRDGALQANSLVAESGGTRILNGVSFFLYPGELCGLIGPSGAGKSTLMKLLLGLRPPTSGRVLLDSCPISECSSLGYVPQDDALHRNLTVRQSLHFASQLRLNNLTAELREERARVVCEQLGLSERLDLKVRSLSGGQRKRVSVALELLSKPRVLVLDEPTSGLDPGLEATMMKIFKKVASDGRILMVATHAMQSLAHCDVLAVIVKGNLAYFGPPAESLEWFKADSHSDIFGRLHLRKPKAWGREWRESSLCKDFEQRSKPIRTTLPDGHSPTPLNETSPDSPSDLYEQLQALKSTRRDKS
jgi:ABC transport system ATP-binding/permease protein